MRISTCIQGVAAITADARHIKGTYGPFSLIELSITDSAGETARYDLMFDQKGELGQKIADIYAAALNEAAIKAAALTAVPVETVVEAA